MVEVPISDTELLDFHEIQVDAKPNVERRKRNLSFIAYVLPNRLLELYCSKNTALKYLMTACLYANCTLWRKKL